MTKDIIQLIILTVGVTTPLAGIIGVYTLKCGKNFQEWDSDFLDFFKPAITILSLVWLILALILIGDPVEICKHNP